MIITLEKWKELKQHILKLINLANLLKRYEDKENLENIVKRIEERNGM